MGKRGPAKGTKLVPMTEARKDKFLTVLRSTGSWGAACEATAPKGAGPRKCYSSWRRLRLSDRQFSEDVADIQEATAESLIKALIERGRDGVDTPVFYAGKQVFNSDGTPKIIKKYSDPLLLAALKAAFPERFGDSKRVDIHHHKADSNWEISAEDFKFLSADEKVNLSAIIETIQGGRALTHSPGKTLSIPVVDVEPVLAEIVAAGEESEAASTPCAEGASEAKPDAFPAWED